MFEHITYEELVQRMMNRALESDNNLDSREGSLLFLAEAPAAVELQNMYIALDTVLNETFADTATRFYLIQRAKERGLSPTPATPAILEMTITPPTLKLKMGERFNIDELNYYVSGFKDIEHGVYEITCETVGEAGNEYGPTVIPIEYVEGLETCTITALLVPGENEEDTEVFRKRYFDSLNFEAFGGNRADYIEKVNKIPGVGGVRVYRAWNCRISPAKLIPPDGAEDVIADLVKAAPGRVGEWLEYTYNAAKLKQLTVGGTVKLVIIDSTFSPPSDTLVDRVQTAIDPTQNAGEGVGIAPIGHVVKVESAKEKQITVESVLTFEPGYGWSNLQGLLEKAVSDYLLELREEWADSSYLIVRISQIDNRLLNVPGVMDVQDTVINGVGSNLSLGKYEIPVLGGVSG